MSTWYKSQSDIKPSEYDNKSSKVYIYLRKNIVYVEAQESAEHEIPAHYKYDELKLPKEAEQLILDNLEHTTQISSLEDAICDLMIN